MEQIWSVAWPAAVVVLVGIGVKVIVEMIVKPIKTAAKEIGSLTVISEKMDRVVSIVNIIAKNTIATKEGFRESNMASRSICYALQKLGCNGDTERAMEHVNKAEDKLNERYDEVLEQAMTIKEGA
jgi:hypothetical protein